MECYRTCGKKVGFEDLHKSLTRSLMDIFETINKRQSVRRYQSAPVPDADLERIIRAAGDAPSGKNTQNWHFVAIQNKGLIEKIGDVLTQKNEMIALEMDKKDPVKGKTFRKFAKGFTLFFLEAPVIIMVYTTPYYPSGYGELQFIEASKETLDDLLLKRNPGMQNLGAALENFSLAATALGYGSCWLTSANYAAEDIETLLKTETGFEKENYFLGAMMTLGISEGIPKSPPRKKLEDIFTLIK